MLEKLFGGGAHETQLPCKKCGALVYRQSDLDLSAVYCYECQQRYGLRDSTKMEPADPAQSNPSGQNSSVPPYSPDQQDESTSPSEYPGENETGMHNQRVILTDVRIPFWRMVLIILKWALASIPAAILMWLIFAGVMLIFGAGLGGCAAFLSH